MPITDELAGHNRTDYTKEYKDDVFMIWYRGGKPSAYALLGMIPLDFHGKKPARTVLSGWLQDFQIRAEPLDEAVKAEMGNRLILEKIEMFNRHAKVAVEMQDKALVYLRGEKSDINSAAAVRMLVEGIRIERISRGVPQIIEKMAQMTDEDLLREAEKLLLRSPITEIEPLEGTSYESEDEE
jgi:hypothetical protein